MPAARLPARQVLAYGLPGLVTGLPIIPVSVILPAYYATELGLGLVVTGVALAGARVLDFLSDPIAGVLIDRLAWRGYRYKHWMVLGALLAGLALWRLAWPSVPAGAPALAGWSLVLFSGWTLLSIPYCAWGAELSPLPAERAALAASREGASVIGMLLALVLPAALFTHGAASGVSPLALIACAALVLGIPALAWTLASVPEPQLPAGQVRIHAAEALALLQVPALRRVLAWWFVNGLANGLPAVLFPLVVSGYFALEQPALVRLLALYFGAAVLMTPAWLALARRVGKVAAWRVAIGCNCLVFAPVLLLGPQDVGAFTLICALSGATLGADLALPPALQADVLADDRVDSGKRRTGSALALWSMTTKLALALAVGTAFVTLGSAAAAASGEHPRAVLLGLYAGVPLLLKLLLLGLLGRAPAAACGG